MSTNRNEKRLPRPIPRQGEPQTPEPQRMREEQATTAPGAPKKGKRRRSQLKITGSASKKARTERVDAGEHGAESGQEQRQEVAAQQDGQPQAAPTPARNTLPNKYPIRRILAQKSSSTWKKEYLVEYFPTWESEAELNGQAKALKVWEANKRKGYTFEFQNRFVTKKIVLKATNPTSDDEPELARQMFDTVIHQLQKFLRSPGLLDKLFKTSEWVFASTEAEQKAIALADKLGEPTPNAAQIIQSTFDVVRTGVTRGYTMDKMLEDKRKHVQYHDIEVSYVGQVDDTVGQPAPHDERNFGSVISYLRPMYELAQHDLDSAQWEMPQLRSKLASLAVAVNKVIRKSPYLLKKEFVWPLFFVRFFVKADKIKEMLNPQPDPTKPNQKMQEYEISQDWHENTRDWFLHAYSENVFGRWDSRALEYIERTYIQCRDGVMQRVEDAQKLADGGEVSEDEEGGSETDSVDEKDSDITASDAEEEKRIVEVVEDEDVDGDGSYKDREEDDDPEESEGAM